MENKRKWVHAICVTCIVLGCLGTCMDAMGLVSIAASERLAAAQPQSRAVYEAMAAHRPLMAVFAILQLLHSIVLLGLGIATTRKLEPYARYLRMVLLIGVVLATLGFVLGLVVQLKTNLEVPTPNPTLGAIAQSMRWFGLALGSVWAVLKVGFFVWSARYLGVALATPEPASAPDADAPLEDTLA